MAGVTDTVSEGIRRLLHRDEPGASGGPGTSEKGSAVNLGDTERKVSVAAGAIVALTGLARRDLAGLLIAGVGGALVYRGLSGTCPLYQALGMNTADDAADQTRRGIHIEQAFLVNRTPEDLYTYWRNFENLPNVMTHLKSVKVLEGDRSEWTASAPRIAGGEVTWEARITRDEPNHAIAWKSVPGAAVDTRGEISFSPAMGDRGTEVRVSMQYNPPAGRLGHWIAKLAGESPEQQIREDLRNFKRMMETGEIPTTVGQPRGTCTGQGKYEGQ